MSDKPEKTTVAVKIDPEVAKGLKIHAITEGVSVSEAVETFVKSGLAPTKSPAAASKSK